MQAAGRWRRRLGPALVVVAALGACAPVTTQPRPDLAAVREQVAAAERAFARSMAERRPDDFARHVSEEAVFFSGPNGQALRGKAQVLAGWARFFAGPTAPFSWEPDEVEPLASGTLAHSSGPVRDPSGRVVARFNSIWRLEPPGVWRVVFDKGSPLPPPRPAATASSPAP
jgi:ketosteroid isomerase-like protein